jgi:hypothetical protein
MVEALNAHLPASVEAHRLVRSFDKWWPELDTALSAIPEPDEGAESVERPERELLEEVLSLLRRPQQGTSHSIPVEDLLMELGRLSEQNRGLEDVLNSRGLPDPPGWRARGEIEAMLAGFGLDPSNSLIKWAGPDKYVVAVQEGTLADDAVTELAYELGKSFPNRIDFKILPPDREGEGDGLGAATGGVSLLVSAPEA